MVSRLPRRERACQPGNAPGMSTGATSARGNSVSADVMTVISRGPMIWTAYRNIRMHGHGFIGTSPLLWRCGHVADTVHPGRVCRQPAYNPEGTLSTRNEPGSRVLRLASAKRSAQARRPGRRGLSLWPTSRRWPNRSLGYQECDFPGGPRLARILSISRPAPRPLVIGGP